MASYSDIIVLALGVILAAVYLFRDQLFAASKPKTVPTSSSKANAGGGNPRDFIAKMKEGVSVYHCSLYYTLTPCNVSAEKAHRHLLRLANRYCGGVCHSSCQGGEAEVRSRLARL